MYRSAHLFSCLIFSFLPLYSYVIISCFTYSYHHSTWYIFIYKTSVECDNIKKKRSKATIHLIYNKRHLQLFSLSGPAPFNLLLHFRARWIYPLKFLFNNCYIIIDSDLENISPSHKTWKKKEKKNTGKLSLISFCALGSTSWVQNCRCMAISWAVCWLVFNTLK